MSKYNLDLLIKLNVIQNIQVHTIPQTMNQQAINLTKNHWIPDQILENTQTLNNQILGKIL